MKTLTRAEEQVMQILWDIKGAFVKEVIERFPEPKPAYNTVSTIVRILENKGFVTHESFGKSHKYIPSISKEEYRSFTAEKVVDEYFEGIPRIWFPISLKKKEWT